MGASFAWTFDQAFSGNVAPDAETTTVSRQGTEVNTVSRQATEVTAVSINE